MMEDTNVASIVSIVLVVSVLTFVGLLLGRTLTVARRFQQGVRAYESQDYATAIPLLEQIVNSRRSNDLAHLMLGDALAKVGRTEEAIATFVCLSQQSPQNPDGHIQLGKLLMRTGELSQGISCFETASRIKPKRYPEADRILGLALQTAGRKEEAIAALTRAKENYSGQKNTEMVKAIEQEIEEVSKSKS